MLHNDTPLYSRGITSVARPGFGSGGAWKSERFLLREISVARLSFIPIGGSASPGIIRCDWADVRRMRKYRVEAPWLIMVISENCRKTSPFV